MTEIKAITAIHQRELSAYEKTIERGIGTFVEVGNALREIRDKKLYKLTHKTFASYVKERWNWSRTRAYELIDVAKVDDNLSAIADKTANEAQAREVAKAPPEKQAEVVAAVAAKAAAEDRKPTAKDYKEVVGELEYEDVELPGNNDDGDIIDSPTRKIADPTDHDTDQCDSGTTPMELAKELAKQIARLDILERAKVYSVLEVEISTHAWEWAEELFLQSNLHSEWRAWLKKEYPDYYAEQFGDEWPS